MAGDEQDIAESIDEDITGSDAVTSDDEELDFPPDRLRGVIYADADVTDESVADRARQELPEVWEDDAPRAPDDEPIEGLDLDDIKAGEQVIVGDPGDETAEEAALHIDEP